MNKYEKESLDLIKAIDIVLSLIDDYPPLHFSDAKILFFKAAYEKTKSNLLAPEKRFQNMQSLKYEKAHVFTYFDEAAGPLIYEFWKEIANQKLPYKRVDKLSEILKRDKIKNINEYNYIIDSIAELRVSNSITEAEYNRLGTLLVDFEKKNM